MTASSATEYFFTDTPCDGYSSRCRMRVRGLGFAVTLLAATAAAYPSAQDRPARVTARRLPQNPLVTHQVVAIARRQHQRAVDYSRAGLGRAVRSAATTCTSPITWAPSSASPTPIASKVHGGFTSPASLPVASTAFYRPQPDPPENLENFYTHVASPEVYVDHTNRRLVMWFHGWFTEGQRWPVGEAAARGLGAEERIRPVHAVRRISRRPGPSSSRPTITRTSYLRVFPRGGVQGCVVPGATCLYGMARLGLLLRSVRPARSCSSRAQTHSPAGRTPDAFATSPCCSAARRAVCVLHRDRRRSRTGDDDDDRCGGRLDGVADNRSRRTASARSALRVPESAGRAVSRRRCEGSGAAACGTQRSSRKTAGRCFSIRFAASRGLRRPN